MEPDDVQPRDDARSSPSPEIASNVELDWSRRFAHGMCDWALENRVTARELAMLRVMNQITDKPDWETRIFDDEVAASWKAEASASELLLSRRAWDWCLEELRYKAEEFTRSGRVAVYDVGPRIVKSRLNGERLKSLVQDLIDSAENEDDWKLDEDDQVLNIIDPSLYPLAYGVTEVLPDGEEVDPDNLWDKVARGQLSVLAPNVLEDIFRKAGEDVERAPEILRYRRRGDEWPYPEQGDRWHPRNDGRWRRDMPWRYSTRFQWLPCDVKFSDSNSENDCAVRLDGYVCNLRPGSHRPLYSAVEDAISASIQPWNDTVTYAIPDGRYLKTGLGRASPRIRAFTIGSMLPIPPNGICWREEGNFYKDLLDLSDAWETLHPAEREASLDSIIARMDSAEHHCMPLWPFDQLLREYRPDLLKPRRSWDFWDEDKYRQHHPDIQARLEKFLHKEPGVCYSFEDWKAGKIPPKPVHWDAQDPGYDSPDDECEEAVRLESRRHVDQDIKRKLSEERDGKETDPKRVCPHCPCIPSDTDWLRFVSEKRAKHEEGYFTHAEYDHEYRHAELQRDFRRCGLQVYVRAQSIQLTPERPRYEGGDWALEGLLNEHVVASSICFFDVENVADGGASVSFRVEANFYDDDPSPVSGAEGRKRAISMYAMGDLVDGRISGSQELGSVCVSEGRVVSFPSTVQYRMGPAELRDPSKPGHVRFLTLCLADPNYHVVSTKRVVPQRFDWWEQDVFPWAFLMGKGLPDNVVRMIAEEARGGHIVTRSEAQAFRARMLLEKDTMMAEMNSNARNHWLPDLQTVDGSPEPFDLLEILEDMDALLARLKGDG